MPDLKTLPAQILGQIAAAQDEASLEAVRVAAFGKKGTVSALLAGLGKTAPDERKERGAAINTLKDEVTEALAARRAVLKEVALEARLKAEIADVTLPVRPLGSRLGASIR
jgi:phenylalanyl-tRNA synthetase alpha chain